MPDQTKRVASGEPCAGERPLRVETAAEGGAVVCRLIGSATMETCHWLNERLAEAGQITGQTLVIDLSELDFICSLGLGSMVAAYLRARRAGMAARLVAPRPQVMDVLVLTKLDTLMPVYGSVGEAVRG